MRNTVLLAIVAWVCAPAQFRYPAASTAQEPAKAPSTSQPQLKKAVAGKTIELEIPGSALWTDTGVDVEPGELIRIEASGTLSYKGAAQPATPEGMRRGWTDMMRAYPVNEAGRGALIGRVGEPSAALPFLVGAKRESRIPAAGRLWLGINAQKGDSGEGAYKVKIERLAAAEKRDFTGKLADFPQEKLDSVSARVRGADSTPGDRTNFVIIGGEQRLRNALENAGWVTVDRAVKDTVLAGAMAVLNRKAYLTIPMSELMLFDRPQDFGYAMADPVQVVAARHHFRIWKAPWTLDGQTVWIGAGTHDVGFDRDQRNNKITHKIDPDTDKERDFIGASLEQVGAVVKKAYMNRKDPVLKARTAHGQEFFSDGRTLVLWMEPDPPAQISDFGNLFCTVLAQVNPDGGDWGECKQWLQQPGETGARLAAFPQDYRVLIVPGFINTCASDAPAFIEGQKSLKEKYGVTPELLSVPNNSSEENAKEIAEYLRGKWKESQKKYILIGYSKGTPDIQVMLAGEPDTRGMIAAFVSVAGASGGSPVADALPAMLDKYMGMAKDKAGCKGDLSKGFASLKRDVRRRFLNAHPHPYVPTYSVAALAHESNVSSMVKQTWMMVNRFDRENDGQLTRPDATVPESKYLGAVWSDHFALALPLAQSKMGFGADKNKFPRAALLESIVRYVAADLAR